MAEAGPGFHTAADPLRASKGEPVTGAGELWLFAGLITLGQFSPGPDMLLLTRTALREGAAAGVRMALGVACGLAVHATIAVAGVAVAFERFPPLRRALQWAAAGYLLWLAHGLLRDWFVTWYSGAIREADVRLHGRSPFIRGLLCNILNPKVALFLAAVCAPFLAGKHPSWWPCAIWSLVVGQGALLWSAWVLLLQWRPLRARYEWAAGWIDGIFGMALVALAIRLMAGC
jgi:threonine/homoserine/homoserine lactone efflux protein